MESAADQRAKAWNSPAARAQIVAAAAAEEKLRAQRIAKLQTCDLEILAHALETFASPSAAADWLIGPTMRLAGLGGKAPIDLVDTPEGRDQVHQVLYRIEYGIPP